MREDQASYLYFELTKVCENAWHSSYAGLPKKVNNNANCSNGVLVRTGSFESENYLTPWNFKESSSSLSVFQTSHKCLSWYRNVFDLFYSENKIYNTYNGCDLKHLDI
jgi:hypothetical protein